MRPRGENVCSLGVERKSLAGGQDGAFDPSRTWEPVRLLRSFKHQFEFGHRHCGRENLDSARLTLGDLLKFEQ